MDVLTDILKGLRTTGSVYFCDFLVPPWELVYEGETRAMFHLVRRGRCHIDIDGEGQELAPGDFVFLAPGSITSCAASAKTTRRRCCSAGIVTSTAWTTTCCFGRCRVLCCSPRRNCRHGRG